MGLVGVAGFGALDKVMSGIEADCALDTFGVDVSGFPPDPLLSVCTNVVG